MRIGVISDTHGFLDEAVFEYFAECDEIWHAGDFGSVSVFDRLNEFRPTRGVYGNIDGADVRKAVPRDAEWSCEGVRVFMTHIGGRPGHYEKRVASRLAAHGPDLFVCGHSHILRVERDPALGLLYLNPGAAGRHGWHLRRTLLRLTLEKSKIRGAEAVDLGPRGGSKRAVSG
jgi:putative phosphoesterase